MKKFIFSIVIAMALVVSAGAYMRMVKVNDRVAENDEKEETDSVELEEIDFETLNTHYLLHVREYRRIHSFEVLKFIDYYSQRASFRQLQKILEYISKSRYVSKNRYLQLLEYRCSMLH